MISADQKLSDDEVNTGRWTPEEHAQFMEGYHLFGNDWIKVGAYIGTRNNVQCRTHAQKVFKHGRPQPKYKRILKPNKSQLVVDLSTLDARSECHKPLISTPPSEVLNYEETFGIQRSCLPRTSLSHLEINQLQYIQQLAQAQKLFQSSKPFSSVRPNETLLASLLSSPLHSYNQKWVNW